jgi:acyl-CoA reductase-like NAD-dependent aldehyde dehydrogenase
MMTASRLDNGADTDHSDFMPANDVRASIERARTLADSWPREAPARRTILMRRLAQLLIDGSEKLAQLMASEIGKPVRFARVEVERTAEMLHAITTRSEARPEEDPLRPARVRRRAHGVVAVITPWNNPIYLTLGKIAPAVFYGNTVVWKPAPETRLVAQCLLEYLSEAGWPDGLVTRLTGGRREALDLINNPAVAAVTLTGSLAAGDDAHQICARRRVPFQAELGGNNASIIWPDANLRMAARSVSAGAFEMAGQRCTANRRVIVLQSCRERFLSMLIEETRALRWGDPSCDDTQIGPLVSALHCERVAGTVKRAVADAGTTRGLRPHGRVHPERAEHAGNWYPPTIIVCEDPLAEIVQEETFGPVLVLQSARDWDDAIGLCNGVRQGLAAAVFSESRSVVDRFLDEAEAGILKVNQSTADAAVDLPFGGWKASGLGPPEHGAFDLEFYTRPQTVYDTLSVAI